MSITKKKRSIKKSRSSVGNASKSTERRQKEFTLRQQARKGYFRYSPLDHTKNSIRLIEVSPSRSSDGLIQCWMIHNELRPDDLNKPDKQRRRIQDYQCLSYRWGDSSKKRQIRIDNKLYDVGQNLWDFLNSLRRHLLSSKRRNGSSATLPTEPRRKSDTWPMALPSSYIWIDALCINQNDEAEKKHQVQRMGQIYGGATLVLIWLGNDPKVKSAVEAFQNSYYEFLPFDENIRTFMNLEYWSRAWVAQEILLSRQAFIFLKSGIYSFTHISQNMEFQTNHMDEQNPANMLVDYLVTTRQQDSPDSVREALGESVLHVLNSLGTSKQCTHIRDRIYSVLAVTKGRDDIAVDYDVSLAELAGRVLIACKKSLCFCSTSLLFEALELPGTSSSFLEIDVPRQSCWSNSLKKCDECNEEVTCRPEGQPAAMLCLKVLCPEFEGHIYAMCEDPNSDNRLNTFESPALRFTTPGFLSRKPRTVKLNNLSVGRTAHETPDGRYRWRMTTESLMKMTQLVKRFKRRPVEMCYRSKHTKSCSHCALERCRNQDTICSWWSETDVHPQSFVYPLTHDNSLCSLIFSARYGLKYAVEAMPRTDG